MWDNSPSNTLPPLNCVVLKFSSFNLEVKILNICKEDVVYFLKYTNDFG